MSKDNLRDAKGRLLPGHKFLGNQPKPPDPPPETETDFDAAILHAASSFGTPQKPKVGLAGYFASLRDNRPQDFALLVTRALTRRTQANSAAALAIPLTVEVVPCPTNFFVPYEEARSLWAARTGHSPVLVIDNAIIEADDDTADISDADISDTDPD